MMRPADSGMTTPDNTVSSMRRALISHAVLSRALGAAAQEGHALDLRANAYGLGLEDISRIAYDLGIRHALHSPGQDARSALDPAPADMSVDFDWFAGTDEALVVFEADVIAVKNVGANTPVSYGYEYVTSEETTLVLISAGFSDGVPRTASPGAMVSLDGARYPVAGRIAMDQCVIDARGARVTVGDSATIWGVDPGLGEWSEWSNRSAGSLLARLSSRVVRTWH